MLKVNCPGIAQETASLYMRLAEHKAKVGKAKSIREARELLPKAKPRGTPPTPTTPADVVLDSSDSASFEDELEALAPDELCTMLIENWDDDDKLRELMQLINKHLQAKAPPLSRPPISNAVTNSPIEKRV